MFRHISVVILLCLGSILFPLVLSADTRADDKVNQWPMLQGDPQHTGLSVYNASGNRGQLLWSFKANNNGLVTSPVIDSVGNIYFAADEEGPGREMLVLYALNREGGLRWKASVDGTGVVWISHLALGPDGTVYLNCGILYAFNPDGTKKWTYKGDVYPADYAPVIGPDGTIYSIAWHYLRAISPKGRLLWYFDAGQELRNSPTMGPDGTIYISSVINDYPSKVVSYLYAIDRTGLLKWKLGTDLNYIYQPIVGKDGTIYYGCRDGFLYAIASNGSMRWRFKEGNELADSFPAIGPDGTIYFGSENNFLYAIDPDGTLRWKLHLYGTVGPPVISADGIIFVTSNTFYLNAIDSNRVRLVDGEVVDGLKWLYDVDLQWTGWSWSSNYGHPVIGANGTVFLTTYGSVPISDDVPGRLLAIGTNETNIKPSESLAPPTNVRAKVDGSSKTVNLTWNPPANNGSSPILYYEIWRYSNETEIPWDADILGRGTFGVDGNSTYFVDDRVSPGVTYYYWIQAFPSDGSNRSLPSRIVTAVISGTAEPSQATTSPGEQPPLPFLIIGPQVDPQETAIKNGLLTGTSVLVCVVLVILAAGSESFAYGMQPMALMLFSRKKKEEVLDNFIRGELYGYILDTPGINLGALKKKVTRSNGTVVYHLKTLERDGLVRSYKDGLRRLFFPSSMKIPLEFMELTEPQRAIYRLVKENPGISQRGIASRTDMSPPKIHRNVHGLESKGFIRIEKGRKTRLYPTDV